MPASTSSLMERIDRLNAAIQDALAVGKPTVELESERLVLVRELNEANAALNSKGLIKG